MFCGQYLSHILLLHVAQTTENGGYSAIAKRAWGKYGLWAVDFALFVTLMGAGIAYFVFIETTMVHGMGVKRVRIVLFSLTSPFLFSPASCLT